jgi:triosephosphate isomerase
VSDERGLLVSGNWKMNENHFEAVKLVTELAALLRVKGVPAGRELSVHPSFTSLRTVQTMVETEQLPIALGAQNCHFEEAGAFTGEVSAPMLAKLGVHYVICGHSERRTLFHESDEEIAKKLDAILRNGMSPILCVGEHGADREDGRAEEVVSGQLAAVLEGARRSMVGRFVVAYEPVWAIGSGLSATPEDAETMCGHIHRELERRCGAAAGAVRVQYGGSVNEENAADFLGLPSVDGLLVGGASLDAGRFLAVARAGAKD